MTRSRIVLIRLAVGWLVALAALGAPGCGGKDDAQPAIPSALADRLAHRSDSVADLLAGGRRCRAAQEARALAREVDAAVGAGRIPREYAGELSRAAEDLVYRLPVCAPPPPPPQDDADEQKDEEDDDGNGKDKGKNNGEGKGKGKGEGHRGDDD